MALGLLKDSLEVVTMTLNLSSSRTQEVIDKMRQEIEIALDKMISNTEPGVDCRAVLNELKGSLSSSEIEGIQVLKVPHRHYGYLVKKYFNIDISNAYINVSNDTHTLNQIIADHFYRQGLLDVGDLFVSEVGEPEYGAIMKSALLEMKQILEAMENKNLEPALNWAATNSDKLIESESDIELKLHSMQFVKTLQNIMSDEEALHYARTYLSRLGSSHMAADIQKLMASLLWTGNFDQSPYNELLSPSSWEKLAENFKSQFSNLLGQSYNTHLSVTVAAGVQALPPILKIKNTMTQYKQEWQSRYLLPVPVDLDSEFQFHSIFVCPMSKEEATKDNPPLLMHCGHVLCKQSILMLSKNGTEVFKCPYCGNVINAAQCSDLHL